VVERLKESGYKIKDIYNALGIKRVILGEG